MGTAVATRKQAKLRTKFTALEKKAIKIFLVHNDAQTTHKDKLPLKVAHAWLKKEAAYPFGQHTFAVMVQNTFKRSWGQK